MNADQGTLDLGVGYRERPEPRRLARRAHPATSKAAAVEVLGEINDLQAKTLDLVRSNPGRTVSELADIANARDPRTIGRRLPELLEKRRVRRALDGDRCSVTGRMAARWWAVD